MREVDQEKCSYSKACSNPGPVVRLDGGMQGFCRPHLRDVVLAISTPALGGTALRFNQRSALGWATFKGIVSR